MRGRIGLYGQGVVGLSRQHALWENLAECFELPQEALPETPKLTVIGRKRLLIENHGGILDYEPERITVRVGRDKLMLSGEKLRVSAMNRSELLISGNLQTMEWM